MSQFIPYLPVALFAESLRLQKSLLHAVASPSIPISAVTGCIKDMDLLWNFSTKDLLASSDGSSWVATSRRHGNNFPLVNAALLAQLGLIGRSRESSDVDEDAHRATVLHITYITSLDKRSVTASSKWARLWLYLEISGLVVIAMEMYRSCMYSGSIAIICMALGLLLLKMIQKYTTFVFGNRQAIALDSKLTARDGAATDVHVVAENWNATELDVLVGYSSHLHALTNIVVQVRRRKLLRTICRILLVVLAVQAAALASLFGESQSRERVPSTLIWLSCYMVLQLPHQIYLKYHPSAMLQELPTKVRKLSPLVFTSRRTALAFIGAIPMTEPRAGNWDWLGGFVPANKNRQQLENLSVAASLMTGISDVETGSLTDQRIKTMLSNIYSVQSSSEYKQLNREYCNKVGLY